MIKKLSIFLWIGIVVIIFLTSLSNGNQLTRIQLQASQSQDTQAGSVQPATLSALSYVPQINDGDVLVTRAIDGDTIEIEGGEKIRYIGIDTPETIDPRRPVQCFGAEASKRNKELVEGRRARLEKDVSETDKYGRLVRYVYVDNVFVNLTLVQEGFARSYTYPPDVKYQNQFVEAERVAREQKKGLWGSCPISTSSPTVTTTPATQPSTSRAIKGNIGSTGEKIYHLIGCGSYSKTKIDEARGERWFSTEEEAVTAGWRKAKNCP